jgi:6,7-dimethyl-8-ribityllumazine synthase
MPTYEGSTTAPPGRFAIVASKFNHEIVGRLLTGAKEALNNCGVAAELIDVAWVPGAFELPLIAQKMAASKKYLAIITSTFAAPPRMGFFRLD